MPYTLICGRAPSSLSPARSCRHRDLRRPVRFRIHRPFIRPSCSLHFSPVPSMTGYLRPSGWERTYLRGSSCLVAGTQRVPGGQAQCWLHACVPI